MNQSESKLIHDLLLQAARLQHLEHDVDHGHDHDHEEDHSEGKNDLITAKVTAMCVLFFASTLCGCIPFLLNRWFNWTNTGNVRSAIVVKALLYFGGGVLLCTTFLHLVPEVSENIESLQDCDMLPTLSFNLPHLLMCVGFFAMYLVEEIIHTYIHKHRKSADSAQKAFERGRSVRNSTLVTGRKNGVNAKDNAALSREDLIKDDLENQMYSQKEANNCEAINSSKQTPTKHDFEHQSHVHGHGHIHPPNISESMIVSSLRGLLVVLALSLHELFEGLAVGLESESSQVWYMFGAVSAHKLVLAFCVGVELIVTRTRLWLAILYVVTFAIVSPIGIGIGILVSSEDNLASAIPSAILQGLASGTLLYVVFFEILSKERSGLIAYAALVIGFVVMFGLQIASKYQKLPNQIDID